MIRDYLWIEGNHFDPDTIEVQIVSQPSHGIFESTQRIGSALKSFNFRLAVEEFLYYAHDGSDFLQVSIIQVFSFLSFLTFSRVYDLLQAHDVILYQVLFFFIYIPASTNRLFLPHVSLFNFWILRL